MLFEIKHQIIVQWCNGKNKSRVPGTGRMNKVPGLMWFSPLPQKQHQGIWLHYSNEFQGAENMTTMKNEEKSVHISSSILCFSSRAIPGKSCKAVNTSEEQVIEANPSHPHMWSNQAECAGEVSGIAHHIQKGQRSIQDLLFYTLFTGLSAKLLVHTCKWWAVCTAIFSHAISNDRGKVTNCNSIMKLKYNIPLMSIYKMDW